MPVYWVGWQQPWDFSYPPIEFELARRTTADLEPIDWAALKAELRLEWISKEAWEAVYANLTRQIGAAWGDYVGMLNENAVYLGRLGQKVTEIPELWAFEIQQAQGLEALGILVRDLDLVVPAPGLSIGFNREYWEAMDRRFALGPFGRGWSTAWSTALRGQPDGAPGSCPGGPAGTAGPIDPNRKMGPSGYGPGSHVALGRLMAYRIDFDSTTGKLAARFMSIDPATSLPPEVLTGFLPPEDGTGRGQGHVSYVIRAQAELPSGIELRNVAARVKHPPSRTDPFDREAGVGGGLRAGNGGGSVAGDGVGTRGHHAGSRRG